MKNKKSALTIEQIVIMVLLALTALGLAALWQQGIGPFGKFLRTNVFEASEEICKHRTEKLVREGLQLSKNNDRDEDRLLDTCDTCISCSGGNTNNDPKFDSDNDKMVDSCDESPNDPKIIECRKGMLTTKDFRCVDPSCPFT